MGDRGNIVLHDKGAKIYLYTHWSGSNIQEVLKRALIKGRGRWGDPDYLHRVIFQELIGKNTDVTGFGLSTRLGDNEHPLLNVDAHVTDGAVWSDDIPKCTFKAYIGEGSDDKSTPRTWECVRADVYRA